MATRGGVMVSGTPDLFVEVPAWRGGGIVQFPVTYEELAPAELGRAPALTIEDRAGFLGIPYVASVRLVPR